MTCFRAGAWTISSGRGATVLISVTLHIRYSMGWGAVAAIRVTSVWILVVLIMAVLMLAIPDGNTLPATGISWLTLVRNRPTVARPVIDQWRTVADESERSLPMSGVISPNHDAALSRPTALARGYIFDLDGTIYLGNELLPGALRTIRHLASTGCEILFLSNNPTREIADYVTRLNAFGIPADPDNILTTIETTTRWLLQHAPGATVFPISEQPLKRSLTNAGIRISEHAEEIDIVIASYDRTFDYRKLQIAFDAIAVHKRARLIATNPDRFCPFPGGRGEPDAAAIIGAVEGCTGIRCEQVLGKPDPFMLAAALQRLGLPASECVMVGDRLGTDIAMAIGAGMDSALVLTGETTHEMLAHCPAEAYPTWVLERIDHLIPETNS